MKKIITILALIILSFSLTYYQIETIKKETLQDYKKVFVANKSIEEGDIILESDIKEATINSKWMSKDYFNDESEIVGKIAVTNMTDNCVITKGSVANFEEPLQLSSKANAITTLKVAPEEALCWESELGEILDLYFVNEAQECRYLGKIILKDRYDINLKQTSEKYMTNYLLIEADQEIVNEIVAFREAGRFEIIKSSY